MQEPDRSAILRRFFATYVTKQAGARDPRIEQAFATVERERFAGPGPWSIDVFGAGYIRTPNDDPAFLYQDTLVALDAERSLNIGHPSSHARWLEALALHEGETVIQVGAGTGYYTTLLAHLVGAQGRVHAYEIDQDLAAKAAQNLAPLPWVSLHHRTGLAGDLPEADAIYVNAGLTQPSPAWLDALRIGGRLLFPLHASGALGGMLRIGKPEHGLIWPAHFVSGAAFIGCVGGQNAKTGDRLKAAFGKGGADKVRSFRRDEPVDDTCWFAGEGWWLSTTAAEPAPASA
jgi:protein-L-isoaspartate(D-aspartate) O-methyltransferase